jgi:hypothetical protein
MGKTRVKSTLWMDFPVPAGSGSAAEFALRITLFAVLAQI